MGDPGGQCPRRGCLAVCPSSVSSVQMGSRLPIYAVMLCWLHSFSLTATVPNTPIPFDSYKGGNYHFNREGTKV
jgi:hypothetical protein